MIFRKAILIVFISILLLGSALAETTLTGLELMRKVENRDAGEDMQALMTIQLINRNGKEQTKKILYQRKGSGTDESTLVTYLFPPDVKGTKFLAIETPEADYRWLYLPAYKKVRRIMGAMKNKSFMGTDFTYEDISVPSVDKEVHTLLRSEILNGEDCYVIRSVFKDYENSAYSQEIQWVRKDIFIPLKIEFYDQKGKKLKVFEVTDLSQIDSIWTSVKMRMHNIQTNHQTLITLDQVSYNSSIPKDVFSVQSLKLER
jgi:hypothetical protein